MKGIVLGELDQVDIRQLKAGCRPAQKRGRTPKKVGAELLLRQRLKRKHLVPYALAALEALKVGPTASFRRRERAERVQSLDASKATEHE